jgi:hypothetical protein
MASLTGQLVAETYKALLKTIDNDILTASEKQITDGLGGGSNVFIDSQGFLRANKYKVTNGLATQFLKADGSLDTNTYLTSITGAQVITALGFTPVPTTRTITINGETHNLAADNTWTIGGTAAIWGNITGTLSNQTDLQTALNAKFDDPTGTISQYIRGDGSIANFPTISGGLPTGGTAGQILSKIDATDYNAHWIDNYATQTKNEVKLGATLAKGAAVYVSSANGTNMIVSAASNTTEATSSKTFGLLETGGVTNDQVKCVTFGLIAGLDTSTATAGDPVWLGVNGALIFGLANKPVAPAHMVYIGVVTRVQSNNGEIFVNVQNGFELNELHDVLIQSVANNQGLFYESSTGLWKNKSIATVLGYTPQAQLNGTGLVRMDGTTVSYDNDPYPSGSGSIGYISKWNTATGLGNSSIYESSGSIGLNTTNVNYSAYGRAFTGGSFSTSSFGYEIASAATANGGLLGGLAYILIANDASRRIGAKIESNVSGTTATNLGADLRFYVKPDNAALGEIARMTASGITFYADLTATNITATAFIKSGGLSNQFLMADGSVTTYTNPVTGTGSAGYIPKWTTAANIGSSLIYDDGTSIGIAYNTPNKGGYGRTLTGAAFGSASFGFEAVGGTTTNGGLVGGLSFILSQNDASRIVGSAIQSNLIGTTATNYGADLRFFAKADAGVIGEIARMTSAGLRVYGTIIKDGGTSSQFLMADGSVSTGPSLSGYVPYTGASTSLNLGSYAITANRIYGNYSGVLNSYATVNPSTNVLLMSPPNDRDAWIYLDQAATTSNYGIYHRQIDSVVGNLPGNSIGFVGGGSSALQAFISLDNGNGYFAGNLGVGTIAGYSLDVSTSGGIVARFTGNSGAYLILKTNGVRDWWLANGINSGTDGWFGLYNATAATNAFAITSGNNFLVGTTTDSGYKFDVNGTGRFANTLTLTGSATTAINISNSTFSYAFDIANNQFIRQKNTSGTLNLILGTSIDDNLYVRGSNGINIQVNNGTTAIGLISNGRSTFTASNSDYGQVRLIATSGAESSIGFRLNGDADAASWVIGKGAGTGTSALGFYYGGTKMAITTSGYVLIGMSSAFTTIPLQVNGGIFSGSSSTDGGVSINGADGTYGIIQASNAANTSARYLVINRYGGNVVIASTTDNGHKLQVNGGIFGEYLRQNSRGGDGGTTMYTGSTGSSLGISNGTSTATINRYTYSGFAGFVGSNTEFYGICNDHEYGGPGAQLSIISGQSTGTIAFFAGNPTIKANGAYQAPRVGYMSSSAFVMAVNITAPAFFESSDIRLKKLIESNPIINGIEKLEAKLYEKNGKSELGYFAQDAELIMPYAVTKNADGFLNLSYREVHTAKIARLEQRVAELEKQLNVV